MGDFRAGLNVWATDLGDLSGLIKDELDLAHDGEGYEPAAVAEAIVNDHVAPMLARLKAADDKRFEDRQFLLWLHAEAVHKLALPCGSCHPCMNWADETWRRAGRRPPHVHEWDEAQAELAQHRFKLNDALGIVGAEEDIDPYEAVVALHTEIDKLRAKLDRAHSFIGEMVLADMEAPLPPYGSEERAEVERPDTEATEQAALEERWCDRCQRKTSESHYHCSKCNGMTGMMGHLSGCPAPTTPTGPRVWHASDPEPFDVSKVHDNQGDVWTRTATGLGQRWTTPDTKPFHWTHIAKKWGPLIEVVEGGGP